MEFRKNLPLWREKANMQMIGAHRQPLSRSFGTNETQQLREGQLVGRMMLQRLATGATERAYSGQRGTRTRMRSIYTTLVYVHSSIAAACAYELRRGFCTLVLSLSCQSVYLSVCSRSSCFSVRWNQQTTILTGLS